MVLINYMVMSKDFARKKVDSLTLGEKLVSLRKDHQVSVNEFSRQTKIRKKYVEAIESGDYDVLPSAVYIRGFIRSYEAYFGLPEDSLVKHFDREYQIHENISHKGIADPFVDYKKRTFFSQYIITPRLLFAMAIILCIGGIGVYIYRDVVQFLQAPPLDVRTPTSGQSVDTSQVVVSGTTHPEAFVYLNDEILPVDTDGSFEESVSLSSGENVLLLRSEGKSGEKTEQKIVVISTFEAQKDTETENLIQEGEIDDLSNRQIVPEKDVITLTLQAQERVFVSVLTDGVGVFSETLEAGAEKTFEATENIVLTAGIGNVLLVTHNEKDFGLLDTSEGPVNDVEFGRDYNTLSGRSVLDGLSDSEQEDVDDIADEDLDVLEDIDE